MPTPVADELLEAKLLELETLREWSPRTISKLERVIREEEDEHLYKINPLAFAQEKKIPEPEAIDLFLYASKLGIVEMEWDIICTRCSMRVESLSSLHSLHSLFFCGFCNMEKETTMDDHIQVSFTILPAIRRISYHEPEHLAIHDYIFNYRLHRSALVPGGKGLRMCDVLQKFTLDALYLEPGRTHTFETPISPYAVKVADAGELLLFAEIFVEPKPEAAMQGLSLVLQEGQKDPQILSAKAGKARFEITNRLARRIPLWIVSIPEQAEKMGPLEFEPFLTGKRLITTQTFRRLFGSETLGGTTGIQIRDLTILFTDLKGSTALYDRVGDLKAFPMIQEHFDLLGRVVEEHHGAIVKTIGDAVMASFPTPVEGLKAALEILQRIDEINQRYQEKMLILKMGLHKGPMVAVTLNDRLDYFGQSVNIAARVQGLADAEEVYITREMFESPGVQELLRNYSVHSLRTHLKGVGSEQEVYRIRIV